MDTMDVNEITKVIDGVYKNITDNFNPASKQMIATGKAYLKSLHGASAACSMYLDALTKLSKQAQQSSIGTSNDIGSSMMQVASSLAEIHTQQLTTLKAFYVDFLVPLETNLEKDVKVIQNEQKKFLVSHKHRVESYNKAVSNAKKVRKKSKKSSPSTSTLDKEIRIMQTMEEERSKLEAFCEEALRDAMTQERRRYGFILERQASLAKHYLAFYSKGGNSLGQKLDQWMKVAKSREALPDSLQTNLVKKIQQGEEECIYCSPRRPADDTASICSQLRKTKSMEAGEMLNIQNSSSTSASSSGIGGGTGGNYHLTAASSRTIGGHPSMLLHQHHHHQQPPNRHHLLQQDLPVTSGSLSRAKSDTSLGMMNGNGDAAGAIYGTGQLALATPNTTDSHLNLHHSQGPPVPPPENFRPKSMTISGGTANNTMALNSPVTPVGPQETGHVGYAKALFAYLSNGDNQLSFLENDVIALIGERNRGWQFGENLRSQKMGWFPVAYAETMEHPVQQLPGINNKTADLMMMSKASPVPPPMPPPPPNNNNNNAGNVSRGGEKSGAGGTKAGGKGAATKSSLAIPSSGRTSDSLHSSNDSGFSNDLGHRHAHGPVAPPPQPEVDYSDEEPQLSNSEELKPGNKWLMERYHMSESARITSATRRRSLSSGNLSTSDKEQQEVRTNNVRNSSYVHNGAGNSPRGPHHLVPATAYYDESKVEGGALKKFLNRTKSLIWRRPSNAGEYQQNNHQGNHHQNGNDSIRLQRPQHALESISLADTASELWGSHSSIVEMTEFEMKDLSTSSTLMAERSAKSEMGESMMNGKMDSSPTGTLTSENDYYANGNIKQIGGSSGRGSEPPPLPSAASSGGPTLPPRNDRNTNTNIKMQMSPGSSSTTSNVSMPLPKEADNSCMVISDHITMRPNKKSSQPMEFGETGMSYHSRRSQRENDIDSIQHQHQQQRSGKSRYRHHEEPEVSGVAPSDNHKSCRSNGQSKAAVSRVESFAVSEAPIIPDTSTSAKFSRRSLAQSGAGSNRTSKSRGTNTGNHDHESQSEMRGRRRLWENHANHDDDSISEDEQNVDECQNGVNENDEQDEDEATIDFNDNDEYDDEAASSVFMEGENEQPETPKSKSGKMSHRQEQIKEPKKVQSCTSHHRTKVSESYRQEPDSGTKRSKSSDISVKPTDTRRSRSTSSKAPGMDTVDMPRRHGGFIRSHAGGLDSVASRGPQKSSHRNHSMSNHQSGTGSRSASTPGSRNNPQEPRKEKSAEGSSSNKNKGLTYKGRPIGTPPPIPAPQPHQKVQPPTQPPPPPPPPMNMSNHPRHHPSSSGHHHSSSGKKPQMEEAAECAGVEDMAEGEPDYGTIKGSPSPPRKDEKSAQAPPHHHQQVITLKQSIVPYATKHQSLIIRDSDGRKAAPRGSAWKGSIRSEIHTVELITTSDVHGEKPVLDYGSFIRRRLYYPERGSKIDQKSERSGNYCGPWYDLWGEDPSVSVG